MCIVDRLEEQKGNSVIVLGILFLCLDFFFSHVAEGVKTYLMWALSASSCIIVVV